MSATIAPGTKVRTLYENSETAKVLKAEWIGGYHGRAPRLYYSIRLDEPPADPISPRCIRVEAEMLAVRNDDGA